MNKSQMLSILIPLVMVLSSAACFGQTAYRGVTPGTSTRAEAKAVLGPPVSELSKTLVEYKSSEAPWRLYVQYRDESPTGTVERVERTCMSVACESAQEEYGRLWKSTLVDVMVRKPNAGGFVRYYGAPRFTVESFIQRPDAPNNFEQRLGFYSKELYESAVPKGGCTGTIFGTWDTDRGRVNIVRTGDKGIQGTYSTNRGSFSLGVAERGGYEGTWKDDTGTGPMVLLLNGDSFNATWTGTRVSVTSNEQAKRPESNETEAVASKLTAELEKIRNSGSAAIGPIITEPGLRNKGLPSGEKWQGRCVP